MKRYIRVFKAIGKLLAEIGIKLYFLGKLVIYLPFILFLKDD
jgi:hypothetical protein